MCVCVCCSAANAAHFVITPFCCHYEYILAPFPFSFLFPFTASTASTALPPFLTLFTIISNEKQLPLDQKCRRLCPLPESS